MKGVETRILLERGMVKKSVKREKGGGRKLTK